MSLNILIANHSLLFCEELSEHIREEAVDIDVLGITNDGSTLLEQIMEYRPYAVITDINLNTLNGLDCIRQAKDMELSCRFIVCGDRDFNHLYQAMKCGVCDYLLKPYTVADLTENLKKLVSSFELEVKGRVGENHKEAARQLFISKTMYEKDCYIQPLERLNQNFCTNFQEGYFRMIFFRVDPSADRSRMDDLLAVLQKAIIHQISRILDKYYNDVLFDYRFNGLLVLMNYPKSNHDIIENEFHGLLKASEEAVKVFSDVILTLCIGSAHPLLDHIHKSREEAYSAAWSRLVKGTGKVLYEEISPSLPQTYKDKFLNLKDRIKNASMVLEAKEFKRCAEEFFSLPGFVLQHNEAKLWTNEVVDFFFDINGSIIETIFDKEILYTHIKMMLNFSSTIEKYKDNFISQFIMFMNQMNENTHRQKTRPVRLAIHYVEKHYNHTITIQDVADEVKLSPVYFASIFKKDMGMKFTEYLLDYRIKIAKSYLVKSDMNVNEVANAIGYEDARYFSKTFKKIVGVNPTAYKKMYS